MNQDRAHRWAELFHETYERLAPSFGYETRPDTKAFDPESPNGKLMVAVCGEVSEAIAAALVKFTQQEPIVWGYRTKSGLFDCISNEEHARAPGDYDIPLYTHAAPSQQEDRKPLTEGKPKCTCLTNQLGPDFCEVHAA